MKITVNLSKFKEDLREFGDKLNKATRPAAQEGAQIVYLQAKLYCPESEKPHMFHGTNAVYGPFAPGNLRNSIYQVFSKDNSYKDVSTYHVSWNADKAPYGYMVELGTSHSPAFAFMRRAINDTKAEVTAAIKRRFIEEVNK